MHSPPLAVMIARQRIADLHRAADEDRLARTAVNAPSAPRSLSSAVFAAASHTPLDSPVLEPTDANGVSV